MMLRSFWTDWRIIEPPGPNGWFEPIIPLTPRPGTRWQIVEIRYDRPTAGDTQLRAWLGGELIADLSGLLQVTRRMELQTEALDAERCIWPLWQLLEEGELLEVQLTPEPAAGEGQASLEVIYWELAPGEAPPAQPPSIIQPPGAVQPPRVELPPGTPGGTTLPPPEYVRPGDILVDPGAPPFEVPPLTDGGDFVLPGFVTRLTERLTGAQEGTAREKIGRDIGRQLAHIVGADRYRSRLVRASAGGQLAVTDSALSIQAAALLAVSGSFDQYVFASTCSSFDLHGLAGEWEIIVLGPEEWQQLEYGITEPVPLLVRAGETYHVRKECRALFYVCPLATDAVPGELRVTGYL